MNNQNQQNNRNLNYILPFLVFCTTFLMYYLTLAPDVMFTDSGELAAAAHTLGITHPTGYPLFTLLGYIWSHLPIGGSVIFKMNMFSAYWASLSSVMMYLIAKLIIDNYELLLPKSTISSKSKISEQNTSNSKAKKKKAYSHINSNISENKDIINDENELDKNLLLDFKNETKAEKIFAPIILSLIYGFSTTLWGQSVAVEVYTLHIFMLSLIALLSLKLYISQTTNPNSSGKKYSKKIFVIMLLLGLSFANHLTTILIVPGLLYFYFALINNKTSFKTKLQQLPIYMLPLIIGASLYLLPVFRSMGNPTFDWGAVSDSWAKFTYHILGKQYQVWMFADSASFWSNLGKFLKLLPYQLGIFGLYFLVIGFFQLLKSNKKLFIFIIINLFASLIYVSGYGIHDIDAYFLTPLLPIFILFFIGVIYKFNAIISIKKSAYSIQLFSLLLSVIWLINMGYNRKINDESDNYLVKNYTENVVNNLEPNAIIISAQWDYFVSAFWYMNKIENYRKDVVLIEKELLRRTWYYKQLKTWYPEVYKKSQNEIEAFLVDLEKFEQNLPYDAMAIQTNYIKLLNSFIDKNIDNRPIYMTNDVLFSENNEIGKGKHLVPVGFALKVEKENKNQSYISKINLKPTIEFYENEKSDGFINFMKELKFIDKHLEDGIKETNISNLTSIIRYNNFIQNAQERDKAVDLLQKLDPQNAELSSYRK
ncbi:MAG: DUF2723 domain-containing protein [Candidatus Kapaibacteriota bacterium]